VPLRRGHTEFFEAGGEAHPIRNSPGYSQEAADVAHHEHEHERRGRMYRGVKRETSGVQRPSWARGMSEERLRDIARRAGANPNKERWWQAARLEPGTGEYKAFVTEGGAARKKTSGPSRGRAQSRQAAAAIARRSATGGDLPF
jgi:hypothetical protein